MKIAHLITGLGMGGAERQLKALVCDKDNTSMSHIVISLKDEGVIGKQLSCHPGVYLYCLNLHKSFDGFWQLYKILRREKPDILQTWLYHADFLGLIFGKLAHVPRIVWNVRCSFMDFTKYSKRTGIIFKILKVLSGFPDAIVTNSKAGREFHTRLGYNPHKWIRIPNGIDTDYFQPDKESGFKFRQSLNIPEGALVVGMIGRLDPMKDYSTFLKAIERLSKTHENIYCLIAGKGTDKANWPVTVPHLIPLGIKKNVPKFLNALDVMVLSSLGEGFPNVVAEAMACEVPVIVTDVGDVRALVQTENQIIPPKDVNKLVVALERLLALSSDKRSKIGKLGREHVLNLYSLSTMRQKYVSLYKSLR
jgi:glycosyltransferase involved in cell wall biosynthesis